MPPPPPQRPLPELIDDAITEILLRIPPEEPEHLFHAALVCKPWRRILTDRSFGRRYKALHRAPPLLGYLYADPYGPQVANPAFVSTTAASPLATPAHDGGVCRVGDCRHGRVLLRRSCSSGERLIVWDPITGDQKELRVPKDYPPIYYTTAVLCTLDGCDHLNCNACAFRVVCCGERQHKIWVIVYSLETREWSSMISIDVNNELDLTRPTLIGNTLYFRVECSLSMLKYDFGRHELSMISSPGVSGAIAMELDDGGLGFVGALGDYIYTWSWQADANNNGTGSWAQHMVMEIDTVLPRSITPHFPHDVIGFVEGTHTIFINVEAGLFTLDLKSRKVKKVGKRVGCCWIIPYMGFYTPDCGRFSSLVSGEAR